MLESTLDFLCCIRCGARLDPHIFKIDKEIEEGILECKKCSLQFPIIAKIPIMWDDFSDYLSFRKSLGGKLYQLVQNQTLKKFVKSSLSKISHATYDDRTALEERWSLIYQNSKNSKFYSVIKKNLQMIKKSNFVLEYGCSIGIMTLSLAKSHEMVFGIDRSFTALRYAKQSYKNNLDYVVSDFLSPVFGKLKFDLVLAMNVLELIEPTELLDCISKQISSGFLVVTDPYDFDRGVQSVKKPLDEMALRLYLDNLGFKILSKTRNPAHIPWNLELNPRAILNYDVDFVMAKK